MTQTKQISIPKLDPNNITGPVREMSGVVRQITPTVDVPYGEHMRWVYVGTSGNVFYQQYDGTVADLPNLASGVWHPVHSIQIYSSGTTASQIRVGS